ncbi:MAG: glutamine--fructose-6-phosphate transaminase (isomerizing), partial [Chloroflexi bacterium]|nr:glutamine--fructose-6-phosphate transaminase (isomerizing) [Chloroflexota bacterium]
VGTHSDAPERVLGGLRKLEYRGYDSWGIAVRQNGVASRERVVGKIGHAQTTLQPSTIGLGHTRWATHGGVTEANAHPHLDCTARIAVIHNGIVENYQELRRTLAAAGHELRSQTDTEVIAHLLEDELPRHETEVEALVASLLVVFRQLEGMNAIAVLDTHRQQLAAAKNGSPLVLGWGADGNYLASDPSALLDHTRTLTFMDNGQVALLSDGEIRVWSVETGEEVTPETVHATWASSDADLGGYPDYMTREMHEQPAVLTRIAEERGNDAAELAEHIRRARGTYLVGCGTAANAALLGQYIFSRAASRHVNFSTGSEFAYLEHFLQKGSLAIGLSQSGETIDIVESLTAARDRGCTIGALVNVEGSTLNRMADFSVLLGAGPERCVLATKSFTAKLAVLLMSAYAFDGRLEDGRRLVERAADEIHRLLRDERLGLIRTLAEKIYRRDHLYVIGRGPSYPLALEAALKIKEVSYIHAEGFAGGELKHGVIALIEDGSPCLVFAPCDETYRGIISGAMEVKARGGYIIGVSPEPNEAFDVHIPIEDLGDGFSLAAVVAGQILAYNLAMLRGYDPDKPRNLAKSVTVK